MQISPLQITNMNWHAGLTQDSHLSTFFLTQPALASQVITRIYNKQNGYKNALSFLTGGMGKSKEIFLHSFGKLSVASSFPCA